MKNNDSGTCGKAFPCVSSLNQNLKIHTGERNPIKVADVVMNVAHVVKLSSLPVA